MCLETAPVIAASLASVISDNLDTEDLNELSAFLMILADSLAFIAVRRGAQENASGPLGICDSYALI